MKKALTIGELLIAMAIIGTIAALVLPGFIKDYQNKIQVARLKRAIVQIEQAVNQACADNNVSYFNRIPYILVGASGAQATTARNTTQNFFNKYFKGSSTGDMFAQEYGMIGYNDVTSNTVNSSGFSYLADAYSGKMKLPDGVVISMRCTYNDYCTIRIDTNSIQPPNVGGRDLFSLKLNTKNNTITDLGQINNCGQELINATTLEERNQRATQVVRAAYGYGCYARLLQNNWEMNY